MTGLSDSNTIYKSLRPKQVVSSELRVTKFTDVIEKQYTNQFGLDIDTNDRVNFNSRTCLPQHVADEVLNQVENGKELAEKFRENRIFNSTTEFNKAITKNNCKSFGNSKKSCIVKNKKNCVQATLEVNI